MKREDLQRFKGSIPENYILLKQKDHHIALRAVMVFLIRDEKNEV